jgi:hypothetical protein
MRESPLAALSRGGVKVRNSNRKEYWSDFLEDEAQCEKFIQSCKVLVGTSDLNLTVKFGQYAPIQRSNNASQ